MLLCPYLTREIYAETPGKPIYERIETTNEDNTPYVIHLTNSGRSYLLTSNPTECWGEMCAAWQNGRCVRTS